MRIDISKVKAGDRVQIANGDWFEVLATNGRGSVTIKNPNREDQARHGHVISRFLITAHQPAQPEPEAAEWVTEEDVADCNEEGFWVTAQNINALLTKKFVNPSVVHTYNGEPPKQYGLNRKNEVLYWSGEAWCCTIYVNLARGDRWMKQPPAPKEVGS